MRRLSALAVIFIGTAAQAQDFDISNMGVEAGLSTLGAYVAPDYGINDNLRIRVPIYGLSLSDTFDVDGNDVRGDLSVRSVAVLADYYFGNSGFRASGGLSFGGYDLSGSVVDPELEGNVYAGDYVFSLQQDKEVAPVLALGYQHTFGSNWGMVAEIGARITSMSLTSSGQENLAAADRARFEDDLAEVNRDLNDFGVLPFIAIGITYRF